jgi:hypothetical protein
MTIPLRRKLSSNVYILMALGIPAPSRQEAQPEIKQTGLSWGENKRRLHTQASLKCEITCSSWVTILKCRHVPPPSAYAILLGRLVATRLYPACIYLGSEPKTTIIQTAVSFAQCPVENTSGVLPSPVTLRMPVCISPARAAVYPPRRSPHVEHLNVRTKYLPR